MNEKQKKLYLYYLNNFDKIKNIIKFKNNYPKKNSGVKLDFIGSKEPTIVFQDEYIAILKKCIELNLLKDKFTFDDLLKLNVENPELLLFNNYNMLNFYPNFYRKNKNIDFLPFNNKDIEHYDFLKRDFECFKNRFFYCFSNNISIKNESFNIEKNNTIKKILNLFNSHKNNLILYNNGVITPFYFFFFDHGNIIYNRNIKYQYISVDMPNISFEFKDLIYYLKLVVFYSNDFLNTSKKFVFSTNNNYSVKGKHLFFLDCIVFNTELPLSIFKDFKTFFCIKSKFYTNAFFDKENMTLFLKHNQVLLFKNIKEINNFTLIRSINKSVNYFEIKDSYLTESSLPIINLYFSFFENKELLFDKKRNDILKNLKNHIKQNEDLNKIEKQLFLLYKS